MTKLDLKREHKNLYSASAKEVAIVEVPALRYLMVDGQGDPNRNPDFTAAIEALFSLEGVTRDAVEEREEDRAREVVREVAGDVEPGDRSAVRRSGWVWGMDIMSARTFVSPA